MKVSVIIPTYNRSSLILKTINSFIEQDFQLDDYEILIIDNNSNDDTFSVINDFINKSNFKNIKYFFVAEQGAHNARNFAAKISKFDILYFTDDDMIAHPNLLREIILPFKLNKLVATTTGRVIPLWESNPPSWILKYFQNQYLSLLNPDEDLLISKDIPFLYSCHQAIKREVFLELGGYNPDYVGNRLIGDGESGLNLKLRSKGFKFGFNGDSIIYHIIPQKRLTQNYFNQRFANNGRAHAYSYFRNNHMIGFKFYLYVFARPIIMIPVKSLFFTFKSIKEKDLNIFRNIGFYYYYYTNRFKYELEIIFNKQTRKYVLKDNWLE